MLFSTRVEYACLIARSSLYLSIPVIVHMTYCGGLHIGPHQVQVIFWWVVSLIQPPIHHL